MPHPGGVTYELFHHGVDKTHKLGLDNRFQPHCRHANCHSGDHGFGKRCIDNSTITEFFYESTGSAKYPAIDTHILAHHDYRWVVFQFP